MPKAIVVEDDQLEHAVKVAKISSAENGARDSALLLACFGAGMTVTELCLLRVSDYWPRTGAFCVSEAVSTTTIWLATAA